MNKVEKIRTLRPYEIAQEVIKISASSNWKCRLCAFKDNCDQHCLFGITKFFTDDEGKEEEK